SPARCPVATRWPANVCRCAGSNPAPSAMVRGAREKPFFRAMGSACPLLSQDRHGAPGAAQPVAQELLARPRGGAQRIFRTGGVALVAAGEDAVAGQSRDGEAEGSALERGLAAGGLNQDHL